MADPVLDRYLQRLDPTQHYLVTEFVDDYAEGAMPRRDLLERVYCITGSAAAAAGTLLALGVRPAYAQPAAAPAPGPRAQTAARSPLAVPEDDPALLAGPVSFPSGEATILAYAARPAAEGRYPAVLICHENRGTGP